MCITIFSLIASAYVFIFFYRVQYFIFRIYSMIIMKDGISFIQYLYKSKVY